MPVHYDPARIRKRFCPAGHDKYEVGVRTTPSMRGGRCFRCDQIKRNQRTSNGWQNPKRALRDYMSKLEKRMEVKRQKIAELEKELTGYAS